MRVLLCGGGSAGHVNPALAIAEVIAKNNPKTKIAYVATVSGIENELVTYKKYHINVKGLKPKSIFGNISNLQLLLKAIKDSKRIIREFSPDIIIGTGGYACYPVILAGSKLGVKTVLHESNATPGKAVKMLENKADVILTNYEESEKYFKNKNKIICVGNPIKHDFFKLNKEEEKKKSKIKEKFVILCYGGSLGAEKINDAGIDIATNLIRFRSDVRLILGTGKKAYYDVCEKIKEKRLDKLENFSVFEYIHDMPSKMAIADVVICRAGAMTISELASMKKCAVLVPSPNVANNHQLKNARVLEEKNAAKIITEDKLYLITDTIKELLNDAKEREKMENNIANFSSKDANKKIYEIINDLISNIE